MNKKLVFKVASSIYSRITDGTHDSPEPQSYGKPLITSKHIKGRDIDFDNAYLISGEDFTKINERSKVDKWDVIVSMIGEYCGFCYVERNDTIDYAVKNVGLYKTGSKLEAEWLYYYLNSPVGKGYLNSIKSGSSQPYLTLGGLRNLPILQPRTSIEKSQIVNILSSLDSKISLNNRINAELEAIAKTIYNYWFVQFDFPDKKAKPYKASGGKMVWSEELKREIPEGWVVGTVNDLGEIIGGSTPSTEDNENFENDGIPWITPKDLSLNVGNKYITKGEVCVSKRGIEKASLKVMPEGTILLSSRAPIGYMAISREPVTTNQGFKNIVPNKGYSTEIVYYLIKNLIPVIEMNSSGSTFKEISGSVLKSIKVLLPHLSQARSLTEKLSPIFKRQNLLEVENQQLSELRDWLLPMLMNGQLRIKDTGVQKVVKQPVKGVPFKPANTYFYQVQVIAAIVNASNQNKISHGEMTLAKYSYLVDKIYKVPTCFSYDRWHLGPYPKEMKKVVLNKKFFKIQNNEVTVVPQKKEYNFQFQNQVEEAITELASIFSQYKSKERSRQTELLATVCKVVEDIKSTDLKKVRESMKKWSIKLDGEKFKNKAEKFNEIEVKAMLKMIELRKWNKVIT